MDQSDVERKLCTVLYICMYIIVYNAERGIIIYIRVWCMCVWCVGQFSYSFFNTNTFHNHAVLLLKGFHAEARHASSLKIRLAPILYSLRSEHSDCRSKVRTAFIFKRTEVVCNETIAILLCFTNSRINPIRTRIFDASSLLFVVAKH